MADPIRIANCSGFYGDQIDAARRMVDGGPIDVLTGDWLAELTMLILARTRAKRPGHGYARTFVTQMEEVMGACLDRGVKVVSNAGGLDPDRCAEAVADVADRLGLNPTIAYVTGDNLLDRLDDLAKAGRPVVDAETGEPLTGQSPEFISANAYLGCWGIAEALRAGADIVVTGRTTDAAIVCGPAAWHHGWNRTDWDRLAGAVVAGHVIECGTQATGGNYSFFTELIGMDDAGFPIAEVADDGSSVITKHPGTGGAVTIGTVTSQLLYEIDGPAYLGPDVTARFDTIELSADGPDRVRISGVKGEPPPDTLKVSMNRWGGFRSDLRVALTGLDVEAKAALLEQVLWRSTSFGPDDFDAVSISVADTAHGDPTGNEQAISTWRATVKDRDENKTRSVASALNNMALASIPGFFGLPGTQIAVPFGVHVAGLIAAELVPQYVAVIGGTRTVVDPVDRCGHVSSVPAPARAPTTVTVPSGPIVSAPLGTIIGARSGDKGGDANLGLFARSESAYQWLAATMTVDRLRELLPETASLIIDRHDLPNLLALNFVIHGLLQEGVAASTRLDGQAKSLGEWIRARHVDIPCVLLDGRTVSSPSIGAVIRSVPAPAPVLARDRERDLSARQREILDALETVFRDGFIDLTMADLARRLNCSLRTLYLLSDNRNRLVAIVIDRTLREHGRTARDAAERASTALDGLKAYLHAANTAVSEVTPAFATDMAAIDEGLSLNDAHNNYLINVTKALLDLAVTNGEAAVDDTAAMARMLGGLGRDFSRPDVLPTLDHSPARSANAMVDLVVDGLRSRQ